MTFRNVFSVALCAAVFVAIVIQHLDASKKGEEESKFMFKEGFEQKTLYLKRMLMKSSSEITTEEAHTGKYSLKMCGGEKCKFSYRMPLGKRKEFSNLFLSYWFKVGKYEQWHLDKEQVKGIGYKLIGLEGGNKGCKGGDIHEEASCVTLRTRLKNPFFGVYVEGYAAPEHRTLSVVDTTKVVTDGQWHRIEVQIFLNDPGKRNGYVKFWVDGNENVIDGLEFRQNQNWQISRLWWTYWSNDVVWPGPIYVDDVIVSRQRIP